MHSTDEPRIDINGRALSDAQAMAVRVAITSFHSEVSAPDARSQDRLGPIADAYKARLSEVLKLILGAD